MLENRTFLTKHLAASFICFFHAYSTINIYQLDAEGQVYKENKKLIAPGGRRGISSISFGYGHFWDCLAAGLEGTDIGGGAESLHGQVMAIA